MSRASAGYCLQSRFISTVIVFLILVACGCTTTMVITSGDLTITVTAPTTGVSPEKFTGMETLPAYPEPAIDVQHYDLRLDIDFEHETVGGLMTITAIALQELDSIELDFMGFDVYGVWVGNDAATFTRTAEPNHILSVDIEGVLGSVLPAHSLFDVTVAYGGTPPVYQPDAFGSIDLGLKFTDNDISAFAEPDGARCWFPGVDRPDDKATLNMTVTVPEGMQVASNGLLWENVTEGGRTTYHYGTPYPIATYLVVMGAGDYVLVEEEHDGLPLRYYLPADRVTESMKLFSVVTPCLDFFSDLFGPYPFESLGFFFAERGAADETQTMVIMDPGLIDHEFGQYFVIHEIAHHWWGDSVTIHDWNDTWFKEGMATYSEVLWDEHEYGENMMRGYMNYLLDSYIEEEASDGAMAMGQPEAGRLYSSTTYDKGAWFFHMLRREAGDDKFFSSLWEFQDRYRYGVASGEELRDIFEGNTGEDLDWFFDQWVDRAGHPVINADYVSGPGEGQVEIQIRQVQDGDAYRFDLDVLLEGKSGEEWRQTLSIYSKDFTTTVYPGFDVTGMTLDPDMWLLAEYV